MHRQRQILSRALVFSGVLGAGFLGLLLAAPLSWAQIGGVPPAPPFNDIKHLEVTLTSIKLDRIKVVFDPHCVQLDPNTWSFMSGFSDIFSPESSYGSWYGYNLQESSETLLTAHITASAQISADQPLMLTISYSGLLNLVDGRGEGTLLISDRITGDPYYRATYVVQENPNCQIP